MSFDRSLLTAHSSHYPAILDLPVPPTDFRRPMMTGLIVIGIAFGGFGTWATFAPLDSAVVAPGVVTVESKRKVVQHREGGIVGELLVHEGDIVHQGTVIATLDDSGAEAQLASLRSQMDSRLAERARLVAERDGADTVTVPPALLARNSTPQVAEIIRREQDRFAERRKSLDGQTGIYRQRMAQQEAQRDGRQKVEQATGRQIRLLEDELVGLTKLSAMGFYPRNKLRSEQRDLARLEGEMMSNAASASQSEKEMGETQLQIMQMEQKFREDLTTDLAKVEAEINDISAKLVAAGDSVDRLAVIAPVGGTVQSLTIAGPGAVVAPGGQVAEIIPDKDRLIVEAQINPRDIDHVHDGQAAEVRFTAYSTRTTPVLKGVVNMVTPDRITDPTSHQGYYLVRVEVGQDELKKLPQPLKAGMPADVMVKSGERTPLQYLLKPLLDSFAHGFKEV
jgi:HlyD family type I secretion membrane fusion protein